MATLLIFILPLLFFLFPLGLDTVCHLFNLVSVERRKGTVRGILEPFPLVAACKADSVDGVFRHSVVDVVGCLV